MFDMEEQKLTTLRTEGLVKRYGKRTVANGVSINVKQGEIVGLLGPNGAGKTTSFYMTTGLVVPNEGHVFLDEKEITDYPVYKRARAGIGYLPQEAADFVIEEFDIYGLASKLQTSRYRSGICRRFAAMEKVLWQRYQELVLPYCEEYQVYARFSNGETWYSKKAA